MIRIQSFIRKYFGFSESETNGFIILIPAIIIVLTAPKALKNIYLNYSQETNVNDDSQLKNWLAEIDANLAIVEDEPRLAETFNFNPNNVTVEEMLKLGFTEQTAKRVEKYRIAGGSFKQKNDLLKVYGISKGRVSELSNYILLPEKRIYNEPKKYKNESPKFTKYKKKYYKFELNQISADSLTKIHGLGPSLSKRIVKFRNKLGGFISKSQLNEVYGLDSVVINEINKNTILDPLLTKTLNINSDSLKYLSNHPYISYKLAKIILAYKKQHGPFESLESIKKIKVVDDSLYQRLRPYLKLNN